MSGFTWKATVAALSATTASALRVKRAEESTKSEASSTKKTEEASSTKASTTAKKTESSTHKSSATHKATSANSSSKIESTATESAKPTFVSAIGTSSLPAVTTSSTSLPSSSAAVSQAASSSSGSSSGGIIGGIIAAIAVIAIGTAAFLLVRKRKKSRQATRARLSSKPDPFTMGFGSSDPPMTKNHTNSFPPQAAYQASAFDHYETNNTAIQQQQQQQPQPQAAAAAAAAIPPSTAISNSIGSFVVTATYIPTLSDELEIETGDKIELLVEYDDGWCQGINVSKGYAKGVFPRHCIDHETGIHQPPTADFERSKRVSSMYQIK